MSFFIGINEICWLKTAFPPHPLLFLSALLSLSGRRTRRPRPRAAAPAAAGPLDVITQIAPDPRGDAHHHPATSRDPVELDLGYLGESPTLIRKRP
ncbi:MAG: hypothetical protein M5U34_46550 [Chloroflexi bacterium]|nr:hypothetical protein [Chloroflexota bacterium]